MSHTNQYDVRKGLIKKRFEQRLEGGEGVSQISGERASQAQQSCVLRQDHAVCPRRLESLGYMSQRTSRGRCSQRRLGLVMEGLTDFVRTGFH